MARRLVAAGHEVTVWNRTHKDFPGAHVAGTPAEAVAGADLIITMLADPGAVESVLTAALPALPAGSLVVEMSTIGPAAIERLRQLLPDEVAFVDAPVLGSVDPATTGNLIVMAGGAEQDLARCRDVLSVFGTVREVGPRGAGAAMKVAVMSAILSAQVLLAENLAYATSLNVDRNAFLSILGTTPVAAVLERLRPTIENGPPETRFSVRLAAKDLTLATEGSGSSQTMVAAARDRLAEAADSGYGDKDLTAIALALLET
ncbi:3-hydroxyisobutyrate dehydrogenase [Acrocarpospora phusangensis]|uniref:3-hydroxyisobutyrate dehydrogenase n=2 Tax=Acrocarpospora phusangensis TaxID=1070424 RepID=A0A919UQH4_9ACTN|nr:3-hydroxyisobutyrate dehydrogenase [Acrocarpospora phusangensis]